MDIPPELAAKRRRQTRIVAIVTPTVLLIVCIVMTAVYRTPLAAFLALCALGVVAFPVLVVAGIAQARREADGRRIPDQPGQVSPRVLKVATRVAQVLAGVIVLTGVVQVVVALVFHTH